MHVCDNCHYVSAQYFFNARITLFEMSLLWARVRIRVGSGHIMSSLH